MDENLDEFIQDDLTSKNISKLFLMINSLKLSYYIKIKRITPYTNVNSQHFNSNENYKLLKILIMVEASKKNAVRGRVQTDYGALRNRRFSPLGHSVLLRTNYNLNIGVGI